MPIQDYVSTLGLIIDNNNNERKKLYLFDCSPDFRQQLTWLYREKGVGKLGKSIDGIFLTHAHMGHYTGLLFLGKEGMGSQQVPVYVLPYMAQFLRTHAPWKQLVDYGNIDLKIMDPNKPILLGTPENRVAVSCFEVAHRREYAETCGFIIQGTTKSVIYLPDIDDWFLDRPLDSTQDRKSSDNNHVTLDKNVHLKPVDPRIMLRRSDLAAAYLDGTFFSTAELPGRDFTKIPHPLVSKTMKLCEPLPDFLKQKLHFIHLNHSNPVWKNSQLITEQGYQVAKLGEVIQINHRVVSKL